MQQVDPSLFADAQRLHFRINVDTRARLWSGLRYYLGDGAQWLKAYETVASWLADNQGRGLICVGTCGLGKSVICEKVLPVLFKGHLGLDALSVTAVDMNRRIDELLQYCGQHRIIVIDDLGTEPAETVHYGNRRKPFCELVDRAGRTGTMLVISTNLRTTVDTDTVRNYPSIEARYGMPTLDRLRATTKIAVFTGPSLRA